MGTRLAIPGWIPAKDVESVAAFRRGYRLGLSGRKFPVSAPHLVPLYAGWKVGHEERERKAKGNIRRLAASKGRR